MTLTPVLDRKSDRILRWPVRATAFAKDRSLGACSIAAAQTNFSWFLRLKHHDLPIVAAPHKTGLLRGERLQLP